MEFKIYEPLAINELGQRDGQEDSIFPQGGETTPEAKVFIVCDGMGGHLHGEMASKIVAETLGEALTDISDTIIADGDMANVINMAYDRLDDAYEQSNENESNKMGTTLTVLCLHKGGCLVGHIGDSRVYQIRPLSKEIVFRTRDHSLVQQLLDIGEITEEEMRTSPQKNIILKAMQPKQQRRTMPELNHISDVKAGDYFYLCSDGMLENMDDCELVSIIANDSLSDSEKIDILKSRTVSNADNHSAYLVHIKDVVGSNTPAGDDGDVSLADDDGSVVANGNGNVSTVRKAIVVSKTSENTHKVIVSNKRKEHNKLQMIVIALAIALACLLTYIFLNNNNADNDQPAPKKELPRKTGDDYLNERSSQRSSTQRRVAPNSPTATTIESRPSKPATHTSNGNDQKPTSPATTQQSSTGQQIQNATNKKNDAKRAASQAIRNVKQNVNGYTLEPASNVPNPKPEHNQNSTDE